MSAALVPPREALGNLLRNEAPGGVVGTFRVECLDANWFTWLVEAQQIVETWRCEIQRRSTSQALAEKTPNEFANEIAASRDLIGLQQPKTHPRVGTKKRGRSEM